MQKRLNVLLPSKLCKIRANFWRISSIGKIMRKTPKYDLISLGIIVFVVIFQICRFQSLPQFLDDYYHLKTAQGFLEASGWSGLSFWDYAPFGRVNLYPPLYHIIISIFLKLGLKGILTLKILGVLIPIIFFIVLWKVLRFLFNPLFSLLSIAIVFSTFILYSSLAANLPATLGIIFSMLSLYSLKKKKILSSILFLTFSLYTHSGVSLSFLISLFVFSLFYPYRKDIFKLVVGGLILGLPLFIHQLKYINFLNLEILREEYFTHYNILVIISTLIGVFLCIKRGGFYPWLVCLVLGFEIIFLRYPYRFFSAQGLFSMTLLAVGFFESIFLKQRKSIIKKILITSTLLYFFFINSNFTLEEGKAIFRPFSSTFYEISTGNFFKFLEFRNLLYPQFLYPLKDVIIKNTNRDDIISSNIKIVSVLLGSISNRAISSSIFGEVKPLEYFNPYLVSKVVVWVKSLKEDKENKLRKFYVDKFGWKKIFENDIAYVYKTEIYSKQKVSPSSFTFSFIYLVISLALFLIFIDFRTNFIRF